MMLWCVTISLESCIATCFGDFGVLVCMGMIEKKNRLSKLHVFCYRRRRNRFLCRRNRVPGIISREEEIMCLGNRFPGGRNRVPSVFFSKKQIFERRNQFLCGRNRVPSIFSRERVFYKCGEPGSPQGEPVTPVTF